MIAMEPVSASNTRVSARADSPKLLGAINDQVVIGLLLEHGPMTRSRIGALSGLSKPTVSSLLSRLTGRGLITTTGVVEGGPGPNAQIYAVDPSAARVIGVHVEQHGCVAGLATLTGKILATFTVQIPQRRDSSPVQEIQLAIDGVLLEAGLQRSDISQVVVATPGVIDPISGDIRHARHLQGWEAPGLLGQINDAVQLPVRHGNDVNLAAVAEGIHGAAQGHSDYALLWLDRGVGLGLVLGGSLRAGAHGGAGEIGYLPVPGVSPSPRVDRGAAGAFQQLVGGQGIRALGRTHGIRGTQVNVIMENAVQSAARGSASGEAFLADLADRIAVGAAAITTLLDPGLVVLGGPVALAGGQDFLERVVTQMRQISFLRPAVVLSRLSPDGALQGAIEIALQAVRSHLFGIPALTLSAGMLS